MDRTLLERQLEALPLYRYAWIDPESLEFSQRIRHICRSDCPMYGTSWACPPGVGSVESCRKRCAGYNRCLLIGTVTEVADICDIDETLATRPEHESITEAVAGLLASQGVRPYILSTEACAVCSRCAYLDGLPCRMPSRMHPCIESHGINLIPTLEALGESFQYGGNVVTWYSLLFYKE